MAGPMDLTKMVPGFDFLQGLVKTVGNALPGVPAMSQWIAPTLDPEELDKRIQELKTVQFWLEQNARVMSTTIQAMEVQRMTLSTLKSMNMPLTDLRNALKIGTPAPGAAEVAASAAAPTTPRGAAKKTSTKAGTKAVTKAGTTFNSKAATPPPPVVDPMQWWGALTQQFTELASKAVKDGATDVAKSTAKNLAGAAVKQSISTAGKVLGAATRKRANSRTR
jgi:hypothetical protein